MVRRPKLFNHWWLPNSRTNRTKTRGHSAQSELGWSRRNWLADLLSGWINPNAGSLYLFVNAADYLIGVWVELFYGFRSFRVDRPQHVVYTLRFDLRY
jgi:hypothetical protein